MRYLILADIHANLEALEAVLSDAPPYDGVICLGDTVGYGASPNECVERVQALPMLTCLRGNHDLAAVGELDLELFNYNARAAAIWTGSVLSPEARKNLLGLDSYRSEAEWYLAHASPREPVWEYMEHESQGPANFQIFRQSLCFVGHTHVPRVFLQVVGESRTPVTVPQPGSALTLRSDVREIVNPGGVGQPRDHDPRAAYALFDAEEGTITFRRVAYPICTAQKKILAAGLPEALASRLAAGM